MDTTRTQEVIDQNLYELASLPTLPHPDKDNSWRDVAACEGYGYEVFFDGRHTSRARAICAKCPNTGLGGPCLSFALNNKLIGGVYGGFSYRERKAM